MLFGLGWPWWSASAERGELARANPTPAAVRRKSRREGVKGLSWGWLDLAGGVCGGRTCFLRFTRGSLGWAGREHGLRRRTAPRLSRCSPPGTTHMPKGPEYRPTKEKVGPLYH